VWIHRVLLTAYPQLAFKLRADAQRERLVIFEILQPTEWQRIGINRRRVYLREQLSFKQLVVLANAVFKS
jgi:hypothetical protein